MEANNEPTLAPDSAASQPPASSSPATEASATNATPQPPTGNQSGQAQNATQNAAQSAPAENVVSPDQVKLLLRRVKDPDLHLNIVDLGLVYGICVDGAVVNVDMTLTSPACPSGPSIIADIEREVGSLPNIESIRVNLVWSPFWTPDKIEPRVRAYLGL